MYHPRIFFVMLAAVILSACSGDGKDGDRNITDLFNNRWNINEELFQNADGTVTYRSVAWGGMVADFTNAEVKEDWSGYDKLIFEFVEPTSVKTQILLNGKVATLGSPGISSLSCSLNGMGVSDVKQVALQTDEPTTIHVKRVVLKKSNNASNTTMVWEGECVMGNWAGGFAVGSDLFKTAQPGNVLEFVYTIDQSNSTVYYYQLKTMYDGSTETLEGNASELNEWGCATMEDGASRYRITLTAHDIERLKKDGLFVNGYYVTVNQCNLLQ